MRPSTWAYTAAGILSLPAAASAVALPPGSSQRGAVGFEHRRFEDPSFAAAFAARQVASALSDTADIVATDPSSSSGGSAGSTGTETGSSTGGGSQSASGGELTLPMTLET